MTGIMKLGMAVANVIKQGALTHTTPFIAYMPAQAQWAKVCNMRHTQAPAQFNQQAVSSMPKAKQTVQALVTQGQLIIRL